MADALPVPVVIVLLLVILYGAPRALGILGRALARAGAPWWVLLLILLAVAGAAGSVRS